MDFTLLALSATNFVTWNFHVDESTKGRHDMILGRDLLSELEQNLKLSDHFIKLDDMTLKGLQHSWLIWVRMNSKI